MALELYDYQERALAKVDSRSGKAGLFMEMGTGKTPTALIRARRRGMKHVLVAAPLSVRGVWRREIVKWVPEYEIIDLTTGAIKDRLALLKRFEGSTSPLILLANYEAYWRKPLRDALIKWRPDGIFADEGHRLKERGTRQARFAHTLAMYSDERLDLTGTPIANGNEDLFSQYRFFDPSIFGTRWEFFAQRYLIFGGHKRREIVGYNYQDEIRAVIEKTAFEMPKSEALHLEEPTNLTVPIRLSPASMSKYKEFRKNAIAQMEGAWASGDEGRGIAVARIVLTERLRLHQIAAGHVTIDDGRNLQLSTEKEDACVDLVQDVTTNGRSVVIFCRFRPDIARLMKRFGSRAYEYHGDVSSDDRIRIEEAFARRDRPIIVCQIRAGSLGIDLTAASTGIFYTTGQSLIDYGQARDRLHRHGQTQPVVYYHLICEDTVDEDIYRDLQNKQVVASGSLTLDYARTLL